MPSGSPQSTAVTAVRKRPRHTKRQLQEWRQGYVFLLPAVVILGIFIGISAIFVVYLSFCKVNLFTNSYTFVKLDNYLRLFEDEYARTALLNSLKFSAVVVPSQTIIALIIASVLNSKIRGKTFFRAVYFLPTLNARWDDPDMKHMRELWKVRNERIRKGEYRESISLAMSLLVLPFAEKQFVNRGNLFTYHPGIETELKKAIGRILCPRVPTKRAVAVAVRTLLLQPKFLNESEENRERLKSHPGYSHARELALIHNAVHAHSSGFENFWPKGDPNRRPSNRRRNPHRKRTRGK